MRLKSSTHHPSILAVGGLDPTGGAGLLMDVAAARAVGVHAAGVLAITTVQDSGRFIAANCLEASTVHSAIEAVLGSVNVGAIKTGALGNADIVNIIVDFARNSTNLPIVVDPVIKSTSGGTLLDEAGVENLKDRLLREASLVTPNLDEASILTGERIWNVASMLNAGKRLVDRGVGAALIKGGHLKGEMVTDVFVDNFGIEEVFETKRNRQTDVRGTGCALASLIAGLMARGNPILEAVKRARQILLSAILEAKVVGRGPRVLDFSQTSK
jgi:hydroxymethylpyrimidine/phosphomethylpyrimidine kinase